LSHVGLMRSLLSCPANEPRKVARLLGSGADAVFLDLQDAVAESEKVAARRSARGALPTLRNALRRVRVNVFESKVVDAFTGAEPAGSASIVVDGVFVDYPIVHKAERIIALADAIATRTPEQPRANAR